MRRLGHICLVIIMSTANVIDPKHLISTCYPQNSVKIDSLKKLLDSGKRDTGKIQILLELGECYLQTNTTQSDQCFFEAVRLSEKTKYFTVKTAKAYYYIGSNYSGTASYDSCSIYWNKALDTYKLLKNQAGVGIMTGNLATIYHFQGNYPKALKYYFQSLKSAKENNDSLSIAVTYNNIGSVYTSRNDYTIAREYFQKGLVIRSAVGNKNETIGSLMNIGNTYFYQKNLELAKQYYVDVMAACKELGDDRTLALVYINLGTANNIEGDYDKALNYVLASLVLLKKLNDRNYTALALATIGEVYNNQGHYDKAIINCMRGFKLSEEIGAPERGKDNCKCLFESFANLGDYKSASYYHSVYSQTKDSLFSEEKSKEIGMLEAEHDFEMQEMELKQSKNEELIRANEKKERRDNLQYSGILIFLVLLSAGLLTLGKFTISIRLMEGLIFFTFLLFFEFTLVLLDPYIEQYSSGAPALKLGFNAILAGLIFPLHSFFESKLKGRITN